MKLFFSPTSPYARKVMACAIARGVDDQIELVTVGRDAAELIAANPLAKVPCLVTDDGVALFDSRVICEFLDSVGEVIPLFPEHGQRFRALRLQAIGDGMNDAALQRREESLRPADEARSANMERQRLKVQRSLDLLEAEPLSQHVDIGTIAIACALGYQDFRFAGEPWRDSHPKLASWFAEMEKHPCISRTAPPPG